MNEARTTRKRPTKTGRALRELLKALDLIITGAGQAEAARDRLVRIAEAGDEGADSCPK